MGACAAYTVGCAAFVVVCAAYADGYAVYVHQCDNTAISSSISVEVVVAAELGKIVDKL